MIKLRTVLLYDYLYIVLVIICLVYSLIFNNCFSHNSKYNVNDKKIIGYIRSSKIDGDKLLIELFGREKIIITYYFKNKEEKESFKLKLGNYIKVYGEMIIPKDNTVFNLFSYKQYLRHNRIYYQFNATSVIKIKNNYRLRYAIKQAIIDRINKINYESSYIRAFLLGDMDYIDDSTKETYQHNGVTHLFAISGSNISFLAVAILFLLKKLKIEEVKRYIIVTVFLLFYMFLTDYTGSVLRATIFFIFLSFNKVYYFHIKTINILLLTFFFLVMIDPYLIYDVGFQFSFVISFYLILFQNWIAKFKNYFLLTLIVSFIAFLVSIPISINNFFQINLLSIFINIIYVPFVSSLLFPFSLITFFFSFTDDIFKLLVNIMEYLSILINNIRIGDIILSKPNMILIVIYYIFITLTLYGFSKERYYYALLMIILLFSHYHKNDYQRDPSITFIDVGQGDSILINLPHNKGTILIDTGGKLVMEKEPWQRRNDIYFIGKDTIVPYLKSEGIRKIDYLILTHGDADHMGESFSILDNFRVNKVFLNSGIFSSLEKALISKLKKEKREYDILKANNILKLNNYAFYILNPLSNTNENDNSIVIYTILNNYKILLMADASKMIEDKIIEVYDIENMDILKVGHHGSITSSSETFLDKVKPMYSVVPVGLKNNFGHPSNIVLERLKIRKSKVFLTSINGSIKFELKNRDVTVCTMTS